MVKQERYAIFTLIIAFGALAAFAVLVPLIGENRAQSAFALLALWSVSPLLYRRREGQILDDERDRAIHLRATQITFGIFWLLFVSTLMALYFLNVRTHDLLILVVYLGTAVMLACHSLTMLILYWRS
jgi:uncharacterized membrane protein